MKDELYSMLKLCFDLRVFLFNFWWFQLLSPNLTAWEMGFMHTPEAQAKRDKGNAEAAGGWHFPFAVWGLFFGVFFVVAAFQF